MCIDGYSPHFSFKPDNFFNNTTEALHVFVSCMECVIILQTCDDFVNKICCHIRVENLHRLQEMGSADLGVNPPSTIPNPIPVDFFIPNPIPVNLAMILIPVIFPSAIPTPIPISSY